MTAESAELIHEISHLIPVPRELGSARLSPPYSINAASDGARIVAPGCEANTTVLQDLASISKIRWLALLI